MRVSRMRSERTPKAHERRKRLKPWTRWPLGMIIFSIVGYNGWATNDFDLVCRSA